MHLPITGSQNLQDVQQYHPKRQQYHPQRQQPNPQRLPNDWPHKITDVAPEFPNQVFWRFCLELHVVKQC